MHLQYMTLQSIHFDMFRHDKVIFREYIPSVKQFIVKWITSMNFMTFCTSCCHYHFFVHKLYELSNVLCTLCVCRIITQLRNIQNIIRHKTLSCGSVYIDTFTTVFASVRTVSLSGKLYGVCTRQLTVSNRFLSDHGPALEPRQWREILHFCKKSRLAVSCQPILTRSSHVFPRQ